ncbi:MAG: pitrilysin family protein [Bacteroidota bacterium]
MSTPVSLADRTETYRIGSGRVLLTPTPVEHIVSWKLSFRTLPAFAEGEELVQELVVHLLDKGTRKRDRFAVAEVLENRGARLDFSNDGLHVRVSGRALRDDVPDVLAMLAEQLREPLFDAQEFDKARAQLAARFHRSMDSTSSQAASALSQRLYQPAHPNFTPSPAEHLAQLQTITLEQVQAYHAAHFGGADLLVAAVGDADASAFVGALERSLGDWPAGSTQGPFETQGAPQAPARVAVPMPDKTNLDVRLGQALRVRRQDEDYLPLFLANYILGGNFSARLMAIIRDEMGLTYGIRSSLNGITTDHEGDWRVSVTLSQDNLERGIEATQAEVRRFITEGATADELDDKKTTALGSFTVGMATTRGLAAMLLRNAERGFEVSYLDAYPDLIEGVTLDQLNEAVQRHADPDAFHLTLAGQLPTPTPAEAQP